MAAGDGLISMTPTSIVHAGTSASINADGGVDFSAVTSLSLNGVFTGDYDNYLIVYTAAGNTGGPTLRLRLRSSGTDATATNYTDQYVAASNATLSAARTTSSDYMRVGRAETATGAGWNLHMYGPALTQPTASRCVGVDGLSGAYIIDAANTHSLSSSYDGFTFYPSSGNITGTVHVFGYEE